MQQQQENVIRLTETIKELKKSSKYTHTIKQYTVEQYNRDIQSIPTNKSNRGINHLQWKLYTEQACKDLCGFNKITLYNMAKISTVNPEIICWLFTKIYHDPRSELIATTVGYSKTKVQCLTDYALFQLHRRYAKPKLVNASGKFQYWSRDRIKKQHTPQAFFKLYNIDEDEDINITMQDGCYQFCQHLQEDHSYRKLTICYHKGKRTLKKIHIHSCLDGTPL